MTTIDDQPDAPLPPTPTPVHPVRVRGDLDPDLSRWLWLVKWILAVPHWVVLALLWVAFVVITIAAFVAIGVTGRYPRVLFDFAVGVLRWSWRVAFYTNAAFGTDRYPPFTLKPDPDYPADLEVDHPERLSRGLVLVKWWLLALPQYVVVGLLIASPWWVWEDRGYSWNVGAGGLVGLLALVGIVVHAVRGSYPRGLFDMIVGFDRWVLRVAAYACLVTDRYPPFRLDMGPRDPVPDTVPDDAAATGIPGEADRAAASSPGRSRWTAGPLAAMALGAVLCLAAIPPLIGGVTGLVADATARDDAGLFTTPSLRLASSGYALRSRDVLLEPTGPTTLSPAAAVGPVRLRVAAEPGRPVFVGVAGRADLDRYLAGVAAGTVVLDRDASSGRGPVRPASAATILERPGAAPATPPAQAGIWVAQSSGPGPQTLTWTPRSGDWAAVVMAPDGRSGVDVTADAAASVPGLRMLALALLVVGAVAAALAVAVLTTAVTTVHRRRPQETDVAAPAP